MTIEKVKQIAREKYIKELTDQEAAEFVAKYGKLSDDEMDNVLGGYGDSDTICMKCYCRLEADENGAKYCPLCSKGGLKIL